MTTEQDPFGRAYRSGRLSDEETAQRMLETAIRRVDQDGLPVSFDALRLEDLIAEAGVARSAVYRRWPTKQHFYADLLLALAGFQHHVVASYDDTTIALSAGVALEDPEQLRTAESRRHLLVEVIRVGAWQNFASLTTSSAWSVHVTLLATIASLPDNEFRTNLQTTLREAQQVFIGRMAEFYGLMLQVLGYRIRPSLEEVTTLTIAQLGAAVIEGLTLNHHADPNGMKQQLQVDPFTTGEVADWSLPALGFASVAMQMIEPDPGQPEVWSDEMIQQRAALLQAVNSGASE